MRDSIWSVSGYDEADFMERGEADVEKGLSRPQALLYKAFKKIPGNSWKAKLEHCASCKCCTRHQTFRPGDLIRWHEPEEVGNGTIKLFYNEQCDCDCRHMARFICRQVEDDGSTPLCPRSLPTLDEEIA